MTHTIRYANPISVTGPARAYHAIAAMACLLALAAPSVHAQSATPVGVPPVPAQNSAVPRAYEPAVSMHPGQPAAQAAAAHPGASMGQSPQAMEQAPQVQRPPAGSIASAIPPQPSSESIATQHALPMAGQIPQSQPGPRHSADMNDNGSALTPPDLSLYEGQLAAMQKLQRDNLELKLELQQAQLKAALRAAQSDGKMPVDDDSDLAQMTPSVESLTGSGDTRQALITMPGYGQLTVRAGDTLPNHWKVAVIDDGGVVVTTGAARNAKRMRLPFASGEGNAA